MIIAWDFDGVLNRNHDGHRYVWEDAFEREVGQSAAAFGAFVFSATPPRVITGEIDILERLEDWVRVAECRIGAKAILDFWLDQDARPDAEMIGLVEALAAAGTRQVIATNNEARRADYIANAMGMADRVERVFASGPLGVAKPDPDYYRIITDHLGVDPGEILFIDDLEKNVRAATEAGWQGFHFTDRTRAELIGRLAP